MPKSSKQEPSGSTDGLTFPLSNQLLLNHVVIFLDHCEMEVMLHNALHVLIGGLVNVGQFNPEDTGYKQIFGQLEH